MNTTLDKSALFDAMEAYWNAESGTDKGVEAAIIAYLDRMGLAGVNATAVRRRAALASVAKIEPAFSHAAE